MAPTAAKIGLTLRNEADGNAGARAMGPEAGRSKKPGGSASGYKVSNNLPRRNPTRATATRTLDLVDATKKAVDVIPSDEELELSDGESGQVPTVKTAALARDSPDKPAGTTKTGQRIRASDRPRAPSQLRTDTACSPHSDAGGSISGYASRFNADDAEGDDDDDDDVDDDSVTEPVTLGQGMQALYERMDLPGTSAARFAAWATLKYSSEEEWANEFESFVAALRVEDSALTTALSPAAAGQTYLAIVGGSHTFLVLHGLQRWQARKRSSVNDGRIVAFVGETLHDNQPPDVWRFEGREEDLFRLHGFEEIAPRPVSDFYHALDSHDDTFFAEAHLGDEGLWVGALIPIPLMWAPLFLDYPNLGTTYRRVQDLVGGVDPSQRRLFKPLLMSVAYACHRRAGSQDSAIAMEWRRIARSHHSLPIMTDMWADGQSEEERTGEEDQPQLKDPPEIIPPARTTPVGDFDSLFGDRVQKRARVMAGGPARSPGARPGLASRQVPVPGPPAPGMPGGMDIATLVAAILQGQNENQLAIAAASTANLMAFHTATAQALATRPGDKESKLTNMKRKILQACSGEGDNPDFSPTGVFSEIETEGSTAEALGRILRRKLKPVSRSVNKTNIYVTPQLVLTVKSLCFSANGDKTHAGCTKGITIFAVPWRSIEAMNEDAAEEEYFAASTLKSVADIRKHVAGTKVELPSTLLGLVRMFNNYSLLLEVLFGPHCPHYIHVRALRDGLEDNENDLEMRITKPLCLQLLWRVHHDARQFFLACERWEPLDPLPQSNLNSVVRRLIDDCCIDMTLTCPVTAFLGTDPTGKPKSTPPGNAKASRAKPSLNAAIPPGCKKAVDAFNASYPTMSLTDLLKQGGILFSALKVGGKGDCTSFGLLGRCSAGCSYNHVVCSPSPERQATISEAIRAATATIKKGAAAS
jgi:hypothetical protein